MSGKAGGSWLVETVRYEGTGRATFTDPLGAIEGPATVEVDADGEVRVVLEADTAAPGWPSEATRFFAGIPALAAGGPAQWSLGDLTANRCALLTVAGAAGTWAATEQITYGYEDDDRPRFTFRALRSAFTASRTSQATSWVLPLLNFCPWGERLDMMPLTIDPSSNALRYWRRPHSPALEQHPLRLHAVPGMPPEHTPLIVFTIGGVPGFIEPLPDYPERRARLHAGTVERIVTAVLVGPITGEGMEWPDLENWLPFDFLDLLGLAVGNGVGAPWFELRDEAGQLVRRWHVRLPAPRFAAARGAITEEFIPAGVGRLLTRAADSVAYRQDHLRVAIAHLLRSGPAAASIEDQFSHLFRAFEVLASALGFTRQRPPEETLSELSEGQRATADKAVRAAIAAARQAASTLRQLRGPMLRIGAATTARNLEQMAGRIAGAYQPRVGFDTGLLAMLAHHRLADADALAAHLGDDNAWPKLISDYRQIVTHFGFFDFRSGDHDPETVWHVYRHLHDLLLRLILRLVDYDGTYQPTVEIHTDARQVGWVTPTTPANRLGYR